MSENEIAEAEMVEETVVALQSEVKEEKKVEAPAALIHLNRDSQLLMAKDNSELVRLIKIFMKGTAFPKTLDTEAKIIAAWQIAASLNLPPMVAIQNLAVIHGSVSMWGQLPKALAERTGQLEDFKLINFDKDQNVISLENKNLMSEVWGSAVQIRRTKRSMNEYFFTEPEAKTAGLLGKAGPWTQYKKIMYARRAMGHAIKFEFPDAIMGVPIAEYDFNTAPDVDNIRDVNEDKKNEFNEALDKLTQKELPK